MQAYANATGEVQQLQQLALAKNREMEEENRKNRQTKLAMIQHKRRGDVEEMLMEKKYMTQVMIQEQVRAIQEKQRRREAIKRMEEEQKARKERERQEKERKMREFHEKKVREEALEAKRAEKLVKQLEKKEREWIAKLRNAQDIQEHAYEELEDALHRNDLPKLSSPARTSPSSQPIRRGKALKKAGSASPMRTSGSAGAAGAGGGLTSPETEGANAEVDAEAEAVGQLNQSMAAADISTGGGSGGSGSEGCRLAPQKGTAPLRSSGSAKSSGSGGAAASAGKKKAAPRRPSR